jgi:ring-1,2-phenylacetyl-CoA epoxidase subunit PaaE
MTLTSNPTADRAGFCHLRVNTIRPEAGDSIVIGLGDPEGPGAPFDFVAGQHLTIRRSFGEEELRRSYSICTAPKDGLLEIAIRKVHGGQFSNWAITNLRAGDAIEVMAPSGHFVVPPSDAELREIVFIAAGSGITPILSQMRALLANEPKARANLLYLNRSVDSSMFVEELLALKNSHIERCTVWFQNSQESSDGSLFTGRLTAPALHRLIEDDVLPRDADAWMLCGPQLMIDMVRTNLIEAGIEPKRVHSELFGLATSSSVLPPASIDEARATVRFSGRSTSLTVPAGLNVLDAARRWREDLPYACKTGVCSTCRAKLIKGKVEMSANHALEPDEIERGFILTCQAYPLTHDIEIDFDA